MLEVISSARLVVFAVSSLILLEVYVFKIEQIKQTCLRWTWFSMEKKNLKILSKDS